MIRRTQLGWSLHRRKTMRVNPSLSFDCSSGSGLVDDDFDRLEEAEAEEVARLKHKGAL